MAHPDQASAFGQSEVLAVSHRDVGLPLLIAVADGSVHRCRHFTKVSGELVECVRHQRRAGPAAVLLEAVELEARWRRIGEDRCGEEYRGDGEGREAY